jgi:hypothetical protein
MNLLDRIYNSFFKKIYMIDERLELIQQTLGRIESKQMINQPTRSFEDNEFQVYSQWGEDGLIQYLTNNIAIVNKIFIEFGVENYTQSNTRFLLKNNNWTGLVIDGSLKNIAYIKNDPIYWQHNLKAVHAFVDRDNIDTLLIENGIKGDIGLLSIDIDGNDYWVWEALGAVSPRIVVCEYNNRFGPTLKLTIPYNQLFQRTNAHYSNLYYGASIAALTDLANKKGYSLVGSNQAGNNAFFVRNDVIGTLEPKTPEAAYIRAQFRESREVHGELSFLEWSEGLGAANGLLVENLETGELVPLNLLNTNHT